MFAVRLLAAALPTLALASCARDTATALDLKLKVTGGDIDQVQIQAVALDGTAVMLQGERTLFPDPPSRVLRDDEVLTLWFEATDAGKSAAVTAVGRRCGQVVTPVVTTLARTLVKDGSVGVDLVFAAAVTPNCGGGGGAGGAGGGGGGAGGGAAGAGGAIGTGGSSGAAGGVAGQGGAAGRGGASGQGGAAGAAGRGGAGGQGGTAGAAGRGGTSGQGGAAGAAGRGGAAGGAAGRGGSGGAAGGSVGCATPLTTISARTMSPVTFASCGYSMNPNGGYQHVWTGNQGAYYAFVPTQQLPLISGCGRCAEFTRVLGGNTLRVTTTIVGECNAATCVNGVELSYAAYQILAPNNEPELPLPGENLMWRFVECPVPTAFDGLPERIRATMRTGADPLRGTAVKLLGQRYGITSVRAIINGAAVDLNRGVDNYWSPPGGLLLGPQITEFMLTDTNSRIVSTNISITQTEQTTTAQFPVCP